MQRVVATVSGELFFLLFFFLTLVVACANAVIQIQTEQVTDFKVEVEPKTRGTHCDADKWINCL